MTLSVGEKLGPYEILVLMGAGGMGEVWKARDTRLDRYVAIKLSKSGFTERARREAKAIAQLNHPNICTLYDVGPDYLVMECIDGETLRQRMDRVRLDPVETVLLITQAVVGLNAAHERGILHRDLKPANIMVTTTGQVKIMDFGLATLSGAAGQDATADLPMTVQGSVMGTPAYMSPEQARGAVADERSDIWSLGVILYEMIAGRLPFTAASQLALLRAIADDAPAPLPAIPKIAGPDIGRIVTKTLEKDPVKRYQTAGHLLVDLTGGPASTRLPPTSGQRGLLYSTAVIAAVLLAAGGWLISTRLKGPEPLAAPEQITAFSENVTQPSLSLDGRMATFVRGGNESMGPAQIFVKLLPNGEAVQLTHDTLPKSAPVFSPDGNQVAYTVLTTNMSWDTWVVPVLGGSPRLWLPNASGLTWIAPGKILFSEIKSGIHMAIVSATESRTDEHDIYVPPDIRGMAHRSYLSPDGRSVLVTEMDRTGTLPCKLVDFNGGGAPRLAGPATGRCTAAAWSPDGQWMYFSSTASGSSQLWRQHFSDGSPEAVTNGTTSASGVAPTPDGLAVITSIGIVQSSVWVHDSQGDRQISREGNATLPAWGDGMPSSIFSHDGTRLFYLVQTGRERGFSGGELWVADLRNGSVERLFPGTVANSYDVSPDDQSITYSSIGPEGVPHAWVARIDRRKPPRQLSAGEASGPVFGSAGNVYYRAPENGNYFIFEEDLASGAIRKVTSEPAVNAPTVSPDGKWLLSTTPVAGDDAAVVRLYPIAGGSPVEFCPRCFPKWTSDGHEMFLSLAPNNGMGIGSTYVISLPAGRAWPALPPKGIRSATDVRALPVRNVIDTVGLFPGPTAGVYAYVKINAQQNLYKLQLPR